MVLHNLSWDWVNAICPTTDGGYLVGGPFTTYQGKYRGRIAKTDANGFLDTNYFSAQGITGTVDGSQPIVNKIKKSLLEDKYYVAGRFTTFNGQGVQPIIWLNGLSYTGVEEIGKGNEEVKVFPNPVSDRLSITGFSGKGEISIYNTVGEKCLTLTLSPDNNRDRHGEGTASIDVSELPAGIYFVTVTNEKKNPVTRKIVKM